MNNLNSLLNQHHETHNHSQFDEDFLHQMLASGFPWGDNQIGGRAMMLHHNLLLSRNHDADGPSFQPDAIPENDASMKALFSEPLGGQTPNQPQHFDHPQADNFEVSAAASQPSAPRQRVRARRGQATDPHSIAERLRRERIAERMKALQELVPNAIRTDKASMLDEIIDYVKFLQLQVKVLSTSRLGGAAAVAPLLGDTSDQGKKDNGSETAEGITAAEKQVAKLLGEDMGSAMQYLQGKGLCLMPISLAATVSTSTRTST